MEQRIVKVDFIDDINKTLRLSDEQGWFQLFEYDLTSHHIEEEEEMQYEPSK